MSNKNKTPVDAYSREAFDVGLEALESGGITYIPRSGEREQSEDWKTIEAAATDAERATINRLDRMYANARRSAEGEHVAAELLPEIENMKRDTEETLKQVGDEPPAPIAFMAGAVMMEADKAHQLAKNGSSLRLGESIIELFMRIREFYRRFKEMVSSLFTSNRFGKDK